MTDLGLLVFFIVTLFSFNIFQMIFWSRLVDRLENKLMSRDFYQYSDAKVLENPKTNIKMAIDEINLDSEIHPF